MKRLRLAAINGDVVAVVLASAVAVDAMSRRAGPGSHPKVIAGAGVFCRGAKARVGPPCAAPLARCAIPGVIHA
jgi:hypothetical protein